MIGKSGVKSRSRSASIRMTLNGMPIIVSRSFTVYKVGFSSRDTKLYLPSAIRFHQPSGQNVFFGNVISAYERASEYSKKSITNARIS